jgi:hypothetical protein
MKNTVKLLSAFIFAGIIALTSSCSKDDADSTVTDTQVTISDSLGKNLISLPAQVAYIKITPVLAAGVTISSAKLERQIDSNAKESIFDFTSIANNFVYPDNFSGKTLVSGSKVTYTITITDSKNKIATGSLVYTVKGGVTLSPEIELFPQDNQTTDFRFFGLADNFAKYSGNTPTINSSKIDFIYYYGSTGKNAISSPDDTVGTRAIWGTKVSAWPTKNKTLFKTSAVTSSEFDAIKATDLDDALTSIDFSTGTTSAMTQLEVNSIFAFKTSTGKAGLMKVTQIASANNLGSIKLKVIVQK